MTPKVSIIVPVWNEENFLQESLESIRNQRFQNIEVIMVDDCSTDRSSKIIKYYETIDSRFKATKTQKNSGTGVALNLGFSLAQGKYQTWVSGDSFVSPFFIQELSHALDSNHSAVMAYSDWIQLNPDGSKDYHKTPEYNKKELYDFCYLGCSWLFRKEAKEKAGEYCVDICEDYYMHLMLCEIGDFIRVNNFLGTWRNHPNNLSNRINNPEGWTKSCVVRAMAKWKWNKYRIAYISPVYNDNGWKFFDMINKTSDLCAVRYISNVRRHDLSIGFDDDKIKQVLSECHLIHVDGIMPKKYADHVNVPIIYKAWSNNENDVPIYEQMYEEKINEHLQQQQM